MYNTNHTKSIMEFFIDNKEKSFTAIDIVNYFNGKINKATIYRRLAKLEEDGIIKKSFNRIDNIYEYQYSKDCHNHLHLLCNKCKKIEHLGCKDVDNFISHILNKHSFNIDLSTTIYGLCKECRIND